MKATWVRSGTLAVAVAICSPALYGQGTQGQTGSGQAQTQGRQQQGDREQQEFVRKMLLSNMAEVQLGKIAVERASNADVKSFAQMMIDQHSKANKELMAIAQQLGVEAPTELDQKHRALAERLSSLQGAEFDRAYMEAMVDSHQQTLQDAQPIARKTTGAGSQTTGTSGTTGTTGTGGTAASQSIQQYAAKTVPIVQKHLQRAQQLEKTLAKGR